MTADLNFSYFVHYVRTVAPPGAKVLDYGCGTGELVAMLQDAGYDAHGCEVHWEGTSNSFEGTRARAGSLSYFEPGGPLPYDDATFDVVVSNQVFEHVEPLRESVREIERVVKPDGLMYHHFPTREVVREGHIGVPLTHRLPKGRAREAYTALVRRLGGGRFKDDRPAREWARERLSYVDNWTVYRPASELLEVFGANAEVQTREIDYCRFRAGERRALSGLLRSDALSPVVAYLFRRLAFMAIECRPRRAAGAPASD